MFIAHLPAGYLASRLRTFSERRERVLLMVGSILPDIDMIYFYTLGGRRTHHHDYLTHLPAVFVLFLLALLPLKRLRKPGFALFCGLMLHAILDTLCGDVKWLWPLSDRYFSLVHIDDAYGHWIKNFVLHWTFGIEVLIVITALIVLVASVIKTKRVNV